MRRRRRPPASLRRSPSTILEAHDSCDGDDWRPVVVGSPSKTLPARRTTLKGKLLRSGMAAPTLCVRATTSLHRQPPPFNGWPTTSLLPKATTSKGTKLHRCLKRNVVESMAFTSCLREERRGLHGKLRRCCRKQRRRLCFFFYFKFLNYKRYLYKRK